MTTAIKLCSVTLLQPQGTPTAHARHHDGALTHAGSTNMIMINAKHTVELIEKCISMKEDRLLRAGNYEPWGFVFLYGALGLLQAHLNLKTAADAKASSIERLMNLQHRLHQARPPPSPEELQDPLGANSAVGTPVMGAHMDRHQSVMFQGTPPMSGPQMGTSTMMMHADFPVRVPPLSLCP